MSHANFFFKFAKLERVTKFGTRECGNGNLGTRKKSFEKARGNAEREEEMKERGHASREGPAGTRAQLCTPPLLLSIVNSSLMMKFFLAIAIHLCVFR